jgi:hypothetical protein
MQPFQQTRISVAPAVEYTVSDRHVAQYINKRSMFDILDKRKPLATALDSLPAWFLRIGAPLFAQRLADMRNLSISTSVVPG